MEDWYDIGAWITGAIVFVAIWGYCAAAYGFLGFALGWMPAVIIAIILAFLWPLIVLILVVGGVLIWKMASL